MKKKRILSTLSCVLSAVGALALAPLQAQAVPIISVLTGDQEVPPNTSTAHGVASGELSGGPGSYVLTYVIDFIGLSGPLRPQPAGAHIHAPALPGANAGVVHPLDNVPVDVTAGTITGDWRFDDPTNPLTDVRAQQLLNGLAYFNLHTNLYTGGEIRGQILVPEPATLALFAAGLAGLGLVRRRDAAVA